MLYPLGYKIFSSSAITRKFYRFLGNSLGQKRKLVGDLPRNFMYEKRRVRDLIINNCKLKTNSEILELGTGWIHRYSLFLRLFKKIKLTLFDVWDNRQFDLLKKYFGQLPKHLTQEEMDNAAPILNKIENIKSFDELYQQLECRYEINENGSLSRFSNDQFDVVFSCNVFEHVKKEILPGYIQDINRILKPGGYSAQIIDMGDHYHYLDKKGTHVKEYLKFSNSLWNFYFDNQIQYINRVQLSEWLGLFEQVGFNLVYKKEIAADLETLKVHSDYSAYSKKDLECIRLLVVHQKHE
jgi:SAM-dependent methyltransferase